MLKQCNVVKMKIRNGLIQTEGTEAHIYFETEDIKKANHYFCLSNLS